LMEGKDGPWEAYLVQADETGGAEAVDLLRRALAHFHPRYVFFVGCAALLDERHSFRPDQVFVARSAYDADKYEISPTGAIYDMAQHRGDLTIMVPRCLEWVETSS
jgi:hypothetical protein